MGCCFESKSVKPPLAEPDPTKHVNYNLGMVLGEDDFRQEFAYLSGRDQWLARDLIGYGTVRGLTVRTEPDGVNGPRVYVDAGVALTPRGQLVCVPTPQCASLNSWLAKHAEAVQKTVASPPANPLPLYVMLCYRECPADDVPIPGEPCRSEDQLVKPSRMKDDFVLQLSLKAPEQREEKALRDYCEWLRRIDMSDPAATSEPLDRFLDEIRHTAAPWFSPPASPPLGDFLFGSPPSSLRVHPSDACRYLRAAFHLWVTELRPKWFARWYGCAPGPTQAEPMEDCVLLAEVRVSLVAGQASGSFEAVSTELPAVVQDQRPYIVHLRMLQEWLLCGRSDGPTELAPGRGVAAETSFGLLPAPGSAAEYARADHTHGTPTLPGLAGDATGAITGNTVNRVRGVDVITTGASDGQVLRFRTGRWQPEALSAPPTIPNPGTSVIAENAFGMTSTPGASPDYARADHTHGTPPLPETTGQFVGRGAPAPYAIVAAGTFEFVFQTGEQPAKVINVINSYNNMDASSRTNTDPTDTLFFTFKGLPAKPAPRLVVKITPCWTSKTKGAFMLFFAGFSRGEGGRLAVKIVPLEGLSKFTANLMLEVSDMGG